MEMYEHSEAFVEEEGDLVFDHTKIILKKTEDDFYYARVPYRLQRLPDIDFGTLHLTQIPVDNIWPKFDKKLTQAPEPVPENSYVKQQSLLSYGDTDASLRLDEQIRSEAEICEILKKHPHPNIAEYRGCIVRGGRIRGLCFAKYPLSLSQQVRGNIPLDVDFCLQEIKKGVAHMHRLGLIHNDLNSTNIMMNGDSPVLIDFDSCKQVGKKLGLKAGTTGWARPGVTMAEPENDDWGVAKLEEWLRQASMDQQRLPPILSIITTVKKDC